MAEELKGLIEKIQEEGVRTAEEKARAIEAQARKKAEEIIAKAEREAENIAARTEANVSRMEKSSKDSLKQAGRDLIIALRKEINAMLERLIVSQVHKVLASDELSKILQAIVKEYRAGEKEGIVISLRKEDLEKLERNFLSKLKEETKKGITLKAAENIRGGFTISYDSVKSYYDFTDKALAEHIALSLKPKLAEMLK